MEEWGLPYLHLTSFYDCRWRYHVVHFSPYMQPRFEDWRCILYTLGCLLKVVSSLPWSARRCFPLQPSLHTSPPWSHPAAPCSSPQFSSAICQSHRGSPPWRLPCSARESRSWRKERRDLSLAWLHPRYWNISGLLILWWLPWGWWWWDSLANLSSWPPRGRWTGKGWMSIAWSQKMEQSVENTV